MVRGRRIPVLVGTIALLAGCGVDSRVEVSGVVRDRVTGRAISGALVVAADGSSTRTDAEGRFVLSVLRTTHRSIRASAIAHVDAIGWMDPRGDTPIAFELAPSIEDDDPDAVLRWVRESWLDESWSDDRARSLDDGAFVDERAEVAARDHLASVSLSEHGDIAVAPTDCASCHAAEAAAIMAPDAASAPHAGLAGGCTACHGARAANGVAMRASAEADLGGASCTPCHGDLAGIPRAARDLRAAAESAFSERVASITRCGRAAHRAERIDGALLLVDVSGLLLGDCDGSGAIDGTEIAVGVEVLSPELARAAQSLAALRADGSRGAHAPLRSLELLRDASLSLSH